MCLLDENFAQFTPHEGGDQCHEAKMRNYRLQLGAGFSIGSAMRASGPGFDGEDPHSASLNEHRRGWNSHRLEFLASIFAIVLPDLYCAKGNQHALCS